MGQSISKLQERQMGRSKKVLRANPGMNGL